MKPVPSLVLLDVPHLQHGSERRDLPSNVPGHLLAVLGHHGDWVTREALAGLFWPDKPEAEAQHNLRVNLHRMKKLLETWGLAEWLHVEQRRVRVALASDVHALREAAGAADWPTVRRLHRQPLLSGMSLAGFPALQEWLALARAALQDLLDRCPADDAPPPPAAAAPARLRAPPCVGREAELAQLAAHTAAGPGLVLVVGAPGVGKSRLLEEACPEAVWLACRAERQQQPLAALLDTLEDLQDQLDGLPGWADLAPAVVAPAPGAPAPSVSPRLLDAAEALLHALQRPVVVDDLQWADPALLSLLQRLRRRGQLLLRATLRDTDPPPRVADWLAEQDRPAPLPRLALAPLSEAALGQLVARLAGRAHSPTRFVGWLHQHSGGQPYFALELLRALFETGRLVAGDGGWSSDLDHLSLDYAELAVPAPVWALIDRRLAGLSAAARQVLGAAAVAGDARHPALLADVTGQPLLAVGQALAEAQAAAVLQQRAFGHELLREAMLRRLPEPVLQALHAGLLAHGQALLPPHRLAAHAWAAGDEAAAVEQQLRAAALDRRRGLHAAGAEALQSALARCETPARRAALLVALARTALEVGDFDTAAARARQALGALPEPVVRLQALVLLADLAIQLGQLDEARRGVAEAAEIDADDRALLMVQARLAYEAGEFDASLALLQPLLARLRREPPGEDLVSLLSTVGTTHDSAARPQQGLRFHEEALATARALGARHAEVDATLNLLWTLPDLGRVDEAIALGEQALALGDYDGTPALMNNLAYLYWEQGRLDQAEPLYTRLCSAQDPSVRCFAWAKRIHLAAQRGERAACDQAVTAALATLPLTEAYRAHAVVLVAVLTHGDAAQAQAALRWLRPGQSLDASLGAQLAAAVATVATRQGG
jgi:tetratricopeptide (TPR) repeat protein